MSSSTIQIFLSTTGATSPVTFSSLGGVSFVHPTTNEALIVPDGMFDQADVIGNAQLQAAVTGGDITLTDADGNNVDVTDETQFSFVSLTLDESVGGLKTFTDSVTIQEGTGAGLAASGNGDDLVITGSSTNVGLSIIAPVGGNANLYFGETGNSSTAGSIQYIGSVNELRMGVPGQADSFRINTSTIFTQQKLEIRPDLTTEPGLTINSPGAADDLEIGWFVYPSISAFGVRRSGVSGLFNFLPNAVNPQIIMGTENNVTGSAFIDCDNNRPINLNTLSTGAGTPSVVNIGSGGLNVGSLSAGTPNITLSTNTGGTDWKVFVGSPGQFDNWLRFNWVGSGNSNEAVLLPDGQWRTLNGVAGSPALGFFFASNYGMYLGGSNDLLCFSTAGVPRLNIESNGTLNVSSTTDYELLVTDDDDIPNRKWVVDNVGGGGDVSAAANITDNTIVRGDGGVKGVQDSGWTIADDDFMSVSLSRTGYALDVTNSLATGGGNGFHVCGGELLGDIALRVCDADDSFTLMEIEADQGFMTLGETYAQTLIDNGVVYGVDNQHGGNSADFNTQSGQYRIAGTAIPLKLYELFADQVDLTIDADWAVSAGAGASVDTNNGALTVRRFDDTTEEGIGFLIQVPKAATEMTVRTKARAETAPGGAVVAVPKLYKRAIPDNGAIAAWTSPNALTNIDLTTNELYQYDETNAVLATWGLTAGELYQFQLTRDAGNGSDTLVGDLTLVAVEVEFN